MPDRAPSLPPNPVLSDAIALLNRMHVVLDDSGCFYEGFTRVCLIVQRGALSATVDGQPVEWRSVAPLLKPRRLPHRAARRMGGAA